MSRLYKRWTMIPRTMASAVVFGAVIASLALAACGGDSDSPPSPTPDTDILTAVAVSPTPRYPPTWTPRPSSTPPPPATIPYTYVPGPTGSPVYLPTRVPTEVPPTINPVALTIEAQQAELAEITAPGARTTILITPTLVENETANVVDEVIDVFISEPPAIDFGEEYITIRVTIIVGTDNIPRPVTIETTPAIGDNAKLHLTLEDAYFTDTEDAVSYEEAVADFIVGAVDTALNTVLNDRYALLNPGIFWFEVTEYALTDDDLTVETRSVLPTATPTQETTPTPTPEIDEDFLRNDYDGLLMHKGNCLCLTNQG